MKQVHTDVLQDARALAPDLVAWRRHFHSHPELSFCERETTDFLARTVRIWGLEPVTRTETGLWVDIEGTGAGRTVLIRADIDALPIQEVSDAPFRSQNDGAMHACGHDGHTAMALGDIRLLLDRRGDFPGRVRVLFQPAEEKLPGGALDMIRAGCLDGVDTVIGLHLETRHTSGQVFETGRVAVQAGPVMANADAFTITVHGKGGHGSMPHLSVDAIAVAAQVVSALQQVVSRMVNPFEPTVLSIGTFKAGYNFNVIAPEAHLTGTVRTFDASIQEHVITSMERVARETAGALGAEIDFDYRRGYPTLVNLPAETEILKDTVLDVMGQDALVTASPRMGGEDFAYYLRERPGTFAFVGCGNADIGATFPNHHPSFVMDEAALPLGTAILTATALRFLGKA